MVPFTTRAGLYGGCSVIHHGLTSSSCPNVLNAWLNASQLHFMFSRFKFFFPNSVNCHHLTNHSTPRLSDEILRLACKLFLKPDLFWSLLIAPLSLGELEGHKPAVLSVHCLPSPLTPAPDHNSTFVLEQTGKCK